MRPFRRYAPFTPRWSLAIALSLMACAPTPDETPERTPEIDVYGVVLDDLCTAPGNPVFVGDIADGTGTLESSLDYLQSQSALVSPELFADFSVRRSSPYRLADLVPVEGRCSFRATADLEAHRDTSAALQERGRRPRGGARSPSPAVLSLSPVGFDAPRGLALVELFWAGGYGVCMGEFRVLRHTDDGWAIADRIAQVTC
jgi:hypothetical protein